MDRPTMTIHEVIAEKRRHGIRASFGVERAGIKKGLFPYATCLKDEGRHVFLISRVKFAYWLRDFMEVAS